jgi:hypothetical protein
LEISFLERENKIFTHGEGCELGEEGMAMVWEAEISGRR